MLNITIYTISCALNFGKKNPPGVLLLFSRALPFYSGYILSHLYIDVNIYFQTLVLGRRGGE
jgi:hypothetical protein